MNYKFSTPKTISVIIVYFLLFLAGDLLGSLIFDFLFSIIDLPVRELYPIIRMPGYLLLTLIFFWLYTTKVLHLKMEDFGISFSVKWWGVSLSVLLPAFVVTIFLIIGRAQVNVFSTGDIFLIIISSILIALKAGILEEILFRGFIMRLLESKWNKYIAVLVPSVLFSFAHLPSMETFTIGGVFLLIISGTLVGTMFSLASYAGNSIGNNILMHTVWNFAIVTDILHITTSEGAYGEPIFQLIIPSDSILLTGAGFGIEASLIAIIGYTLACLTLAFIYRRNHVGILEGYRRRECIKHTRHLYPIDITGCALHSANSLCPSSLSKKACISGNRTRARAVRNFLCRQSALLRLIW